MARINGSTNSNQWTFKLEVSEGSYNITNNTSPVYVSIYLGRASSRSYCGGTFSGSVNIAGTTKNYSGTVPYPTYIDGGGWYKLGEVSTNVEHNPDGSKTASISASFSSNFTPSSASASGSVTLTTIPRASDIACSSPYIGDVATITIQKKSNSFTNTVTYEIGTGSNKLTGTVATKTSSTVLSLQTSEIEDNIYALIPNGKEISCKVFCTTYNGNSQIGSTKSSNFNLYAKESVCKPDVSAIATDTNEETIAITGDNTKFIKYISKPKVTITAIAKKNSSIASYLINMNDGHTSNIAENTFESIETNSISTGVVDTRGYSDTYPIDLTDRIYDYVKLHINDISITRPEGTSNEAILNCNGAYFNGSFGDTSNTLSVSFQYRKTGDEEWIDGGTITPTIQDNTFRFYDLSLGNIYDYNEEYQFKLIFQDLFMTIGNLNADIQTLPVGQEVIAISEDGVDVYGYLKLNDADITSIVESGRNEHGDWIKFADGRMVCFCTRSFFGLELQKAWGNVFETENKHDFGLFPQEFIEIPTITVTLQSGHTCYAETFTGLESTTTSKIGATWLWAPVRRSNGNATLSVTAWGKWSDNIDLPSLVSQTQKSADELTEDIMNRLNVDLNIAVIRTNSMNKSYTNSGFVKIIDWVTETSLGTDLTPVPNDGCVIIRNAELVEIKGHICGQGYCWTRTRIYDGTENGGLVDTIEMLNQFGGNGYWGSSLGSKIVNLDKNKTYWVEVDVMGYNGSTFYLNKGFSDNSTWLEVRKIK